MTSRIAYNHPGEDGALGLPYHHELLADRRRLAPLRRAVELAARGKRVLESGAGSGILSILAARAGARVVYAVERDHAVARFLRQNVRRCGYEAIVRVIEKDTRALTPADLDGEAVDVALAEHLSTWQVTEPQISVMNHVNRQLAGEAATHIPELAWNRLELVNSQFRFEDLVDLRTHYFGFSGIARPQALSAPALFRRVDFKLVNEVMVDAVVPVEATRDGVANSLRLTSPLQVLGDISFQSSDSLMPPVVVPLLEDLRVRAGDVVNVRCRYQCETSWSKLVCEAALALRPARQPTSRPGLDVNFSPIRLSAEPAKR